MSLNWNTNNLSRSRIPNTSYKELQDHTEMLSSYGSWCVYLTALNIIQVAFYKKMSILLRVEHTDGKMRACFGGFDSHPFDRLRLHCVPRCQHQSQESNRQHNYVVATVNIATVRSRFAPSYVTVAN